MEVQAQQWPARVVDIVDEYRVVMNRGSRDGVKVGQRFLVYGVGESELVDPDTGENLGRLEVVRGIGNVTHVQEKVATISSTQSAPLPKRIVRRTTGFFGPPETETIQEGAETLPFDSPTKGDYVRPI